MAVLHHAFRFAMTPDLDRHVLDVLQAGDREKLSTLAKAAYGEIRSREDLHAAFHLGPDGAAPSWLEPQFISPGFAALVICARYFEPLPNLSASDDTNHDRLIKHLPALGWSSEEIDYLVHGRPIETVLQVFAKSDSEFAAGGFSHTGGWTSPEMVKKLSLRLDDLALEPPQSPDNKAHKAWRALNETRALDDARAMLAPLGPNDWLVMSVTH